VKLQQLILCLIILLKIIIAQISIFPKTEGFLYGSNRGHDSIVVFEIDQQSGQLEYISHHSVKGEWPRNFTIDPSGQYLLVANQKSDNIVVFKIDEDSGRLQETGVEVSTSMPVCLKMMPIQ
jgi:6-phosphogluconolactonase